jgi:hypothetical protein
MNTKKYAQSGFLDLHALVILLLSAVTSLTVGGTLLGLFRPETQAGVSQRTLTFEERVAYQRATEEVYWRHRIWPKENPDPKPPLDAAMTQAQIEKKVEDYLSKSQALEDSYWLITASQLQTEMDRMAQHTRQPEVLRELFEALGNDPFVIAECLARPVLTERLVANLSEQNKTSPLQSAWTKAMPDMSMATTLATKVYTLPKIFEGTPPCTDDTWTATSTTDAPDARSFHTAVWGGQGGTGINFFNTGGQYHPSTDSWTPTTTTNAPEARRLHTAVWTGSEMIVWGGFNSPIRPPLNTGGRYNPSTDSWTATTTTNAPTGRTGHSAVWTGSDMIIWGGSFLNTGGRYDPSTDSWTPTSLTNAPAGREFHTAIWTRSQMII